MATQKDKDGKVSLFPGQMFLHGTVESFGEVEQRGKKKWIIRLHVPNEKNPQYPDTYNIQVMEKNVSKTKCREGDSVDVTVYGHSRAWTDMVFADFVLAWLDVTQANPDAPHLPSADQSVPAPEVPGETVLPF